MIHGYLLDTNMIEYWFNKDRQEHPAFLRHLGSLPADAPLVTSSVVLGEVLYGYQAAPACRREYCREVSQFIGIQFPMLLDVRPSTAEVYGKLRAALFEEYAPKGRRQGLRPQQLTDPLTSEKLGIDENDLWIASQAIEHNLTLVTHDRMASLLKVVNDLRVEDWAADVSK